MLQRGHDWFTGPVGSYRLTMREQFALMGVVLLVDGVLGGLTGLIGWQWYFDHPVTAIPPTLVTFAVFYRWRKRVAVSNGHLPDGSHPRP